MVINMAKLREKAGGKPATSTPPRIYPSREEIDNKIKRIMEGKMEANQTASPHRPVENGGEIGGTIDRPRRSIW